MTALDNDDLTARSHDWLMTSSPTAPHGWSKINPVHTLAVEGVSCPGQVSRSFVI